MSTRRQLVTVVMAVGLLVPLAAAPASGAPPANDEPAGALVLQLGGEVVQDTREATTTPQDEALNASCGAPATTASVWFTYAPDRDRMVVLDVTASDYSGGVLVFAGTPTVDSLVTCGPGSVVLRARAGTTYSIMVVSDTGVNGGRLVLSLENAPPPPRVHVSMARRGVAFRGGEGAARLNGTYSCRNGEFAALNGTLFQRAGRLKIQAEFSRTIRCNGKRRSWSARVVSPVGTYARGRAVARVRIIGCGIVACRQARTRQVVQLAWAAGSPGPQRVEPPTTTTRPRPLVELQERWPGS